VSALTIQAARLRLCRIPVDPPRGDAIQQFDALERFTVWTDQSSSSPAHQPA
jgi:hypothetical protein